MNFYSTVLSSIQIGSLKLKNRVVMPAMGTQFASENGVVTDRLISYYAERARGGVGLIVTEHAGISEEGRAVPRMLMASNEGHVPGLLKLVEAIHREGAKTAVQLNHAGRTCSVTALSVRELEDLARQWAEAALRAKASGADAVEIHMAHGYLLHQFLSPLRNTRVDSYGGSPQARAKFPSEVLRKVRAAVGQDYPVWCRLSAAEFLDGGIDIESAKVTAVVLEKAGANAVHVSAGTSDSLFSMHPTYYSVDCPNIDKAEAVKSVVRVPVIAVGKIKDLDMADRLVREGRCDLVAVGRPFIADPQWLEKSCQGRFDEIVPCLSCCRCVKAYREGRLRCTVNPRVGRENEFDSTPTESSQTVLVIGGGVAGLKCAEMCAKAGHRVTLVEKNNCLGGQVTRGALPPGKKDLETFLLHLERQARNAGVNIQLGREVKAEEMIEWKPDVIVVASGAAPKVPRFPGIDTVHKLLTFEDILLPELPSGIGENILILGGGTVGGEVADYLASHGKSVTIVEMRGEIAFDAVAHLKHDLRTRLHDRQVQMLTNTKVLGFENNDVLVDGEKGRMLLRGYDTIVLAMGMVSAGNLFSEQLSGKAKKVFVIGDSRLPGEIVDAMEDGYEIASRI